MAANPFAINPFASPLLAAKMAISPDNPFAPGYKPRSALGEIGSQLAAGVTAEVPRQAGQALQYVSEPGQPLYETGKGWAEAAEKRGALPQYQPHPEEHGAVVNALASGARMLAPSVVAPLAVGAGLAALPEATIGGTAALGLSALAGSVPAALQQGQQTLEDLRAQGVPEEDARAAARRTAAIEGTLESVGTYAGGKLFGIGGRALSKAVTPGEAALAGATAPGLVRPFVKQLGETAATEVGTEVAQAGGEAAVEQAYGGKGISPLEAAGQVVGPTLGMTALLAPFGLAGFVHGNRAIQKRAAELTSEKTDPAARVEAAGAIAREIHPHDPAAAAQFHANVMADIQAGAPIALGPDLLEARVAPVQMPGIAPAPPLAGAPLATPPPLGPVSRALDTAVAGQVPTGPPVQPAADFLTPPPVPLLKQHVPRGTLQPITGGLDESIQTQTPAAQRPNATTAANALIAAREAGQPLPEIPAPTPAGQRGGRPSPAAGPAAETAPPREAVPKEEVAHAITQPYPETRHGGRGPRPGVRGEAGYPAVRGQGVQPGRPEGQRQGPAGAGAEEGQAARVPVVAARAPARERERKEGVARPAGYEPSLTQATQKARILEGPATPVASAEPQAQGAPTTATTPKGQKVGLRYQLVEAADLIASHDAEGKPNPAYPAALQPRDRSRQASTLQIQRIAGNLVPERLGASPTVGEGAPIVGPDNAIESGNGRVLALRKVYSGGGAKMQAYRAHLRENAEKFGLAPATVEAMKAPVLVRTRTTKMTDPERAAFARDANESTTARMSPAEEARADAARMTLEDYHPDEDGNVLAMQNRGFVKRFIAGLGPEEAAALTTAEGAPTRQLADRIRAAVFYSAYRDERLLGLFAEEADPEIRNVIAALNRAAPEFARARGLSEDLGPYNIVPAIVEAADIIRQARQANQVVIEVIAQQGLFGAQDPNAQAIALFMDANKRSAKRLGEGLRAMAAFIEGELRKAGNLALFAEAPPTLGDVIARANKYIQERHGQEHAINQDLFSESERREGAAEARTERSKPKEGEPARAAAPAAEETVAPERRADITRRKTIAQMSPEEMRRELLTDSLTGLGNRRAWDEAEKGPVLASLDMDALKFVNDTMGHASGDKMLAAMGEALNEVMPGQAFHVSGDEFLAHFEDQKQADRALAEVADLLDRATVSVRLPDGTIITKTGVGYSYGTGSRLEDAEAGLQRHKAERERAGLRAARGGEPAGVARKAAEGQPGRGREAAAEVTPPPYGAANRVFTAEAAKMARERLRSKLGTVRAGLDPKMFQDGLTLAGFHIEAGAREFAAFAKAMIKDLGEGIRPYLRRLFNAVKENQGFDFGAPAEATAAVEPPAPTPAAAAPEAKPSPPKAAAGYEIGDEVRPIPGKGPSIRKAGRVQNVRTSDEGDQRIAIEGQGGYFLASGYELVSGTTPADVTEKPIGPENVRRDRGAGVEGPEPPGIPTPAGAAEAPAVPGEPGGAVRAGRKRTDEGGPTERAGEPVPSEGAGGRGREAPDTGGPDRAARRAAKRTEQAERAARELKGTNYRITPADAIGTGGWKTRARQNIEAIKLVKALTAEGRPATTVEQATLVKYVGWGSSELANGMFENYGRFKEGWETLGKELEQLLTEEELAAARASTLNAHYTSPAVIGGIYQALEQFGFKGGRILEPGAGIGHFIGLRPEGLAKSTRYTAVELDPISAAIGKALYPREDVRSQDFAKFLMPKNFFDVAIGNPPFADIKISKDPEYARFRYPLHDFMIVKSLDRVRPGGMMALVTSKGTMDKTNPVARIAIEKQADLIGAIRLPQTAFKENAGTEVVTDILFFRKRLPGEKKGGEAWSKSAEVKTPEGPTSVNEYYIAHPEMVLGKHSLQGSMYGPSQYTVLPHRGEDIEDSIKAAIARLPKDLYQETTTERPPEQALDADLNPDTPKENAYYLKGTMVHQRRSGVGVPQANLSKRDADIIKRFVPLRDAGLKVLAVQMDRQAGEADLETAQGALGRAHDAFVKDFGPVNQEIVRRFTDAKGVERETVRTPNLDPFKDDPDAYRVAAFEIFDRKTGQATKAAIFTERVINPVTAPKIEGPADALHLTIADLGRVDIKRIAELSHLTETQTTEALGDAIYENPETRAWETAADYLSGPVRQKLKYAEAATLAEPAYQRNVTALKAAQPADLPPSRIHIAFGAPFLRKEDIRDFAQELGLAINVTHAPEFAAWGIEGRYGAEDSIAATSEWGTPRFNAVRLLDAALNKRSVKVMDYIDKKPVLNVEATEAANEKLARMKERFASWIFQDGERADHYVRTYNDTYNDSVKRDFGGPHIDFMRFPGLTSKIAPRAHQKRVAYRIIQRGNTYMAHEVGAGKTIGSILAGMELKRLGIKKKPAYVVPNHMLNQFAREFLQLYPAAKILVADETSFGATERNRFMGRIASENWDGIIVTHSAFGKIPLSAQYQQDFIQGFLDELRAMLEVNEGNRLKTKQIERAIERLEQRLAKILAGATKDKGVSFEETGIDQLFVDEAQEFRKIDFITNMSDIKGVDPSGSMKAFDLMNKNRYLESLYPGRSLVLLSGTPITNTLGEAFSIQRLLQPETLKARGIDSFDAWAATFGDTVTELEPDPAGKYRVVTRFAQFVNVGQLSSMFGEVCDAVFTKDIQGLNLPKVKGGHRQTILAEMTPLQLDYQDKLDERLKLIKERKGSPMKGDDIILTVITDGQHAALDQRFIEADAGADPGSKIEQMVDKVVELWETHKDARLTQMIFNDMGLPAAEEKRGFSSYNYIRKTLIRRGIPPREIAFIQDYKQHDAKQKLFEAVNRGDVRVLIGSSQAMGTGVNAQKLLMALHHLDPDRYLPANIAQREGRIVRQGNTNEEVEVYAYATKGPSDEAMWGTMERKQRFIDDFLKGQVATDSTEDVDGGANLFALARALSSRDPRVMQLASLEGDLQRLTRLESSHRDDQVRLRRIIHGNKQGIAANERANAELEETIEAVTDTRGDKFRAEALGKTYTERKTAGEALLAHAHEAVEKAKKEGLPRAVNVGKVAGLPIRFGVTKFGTGNFYAQFILVGKGSQSTNLPDIDEFGLKNKDPAQLMVGLENRSRAFESKLQNNERSIANLNKEIADANERIGLPFEKAAELQEKRAEVADLKRALNAEEQQEDSGVRYSYLDRNAVAESRDGKPTGHTPATLRIALAERLGKRAFGKLLGSREFRIVARDEDLPAGLQHPEGGVRGVFDKGVSYLVTGNIRPGEELGVLLHEVGTHAGLEGLLGKDLHAKVLGEIERAAKVGSINRNASPLVAAVMAARGRVPNDTAARYVTEETLAYLVENRANHDLPLVKRILAAVRAFLLRLGVPLKNVGPDDLVALARAAVRRVSRGETVQRGVVAEGQAEPRYSRGAPPPLIARQDAATQEALRKAGVIYHPPTLAARVRAWLPDWQKRVRQGLVDAFDPIKHYDYKAYMKARLTKGADAGLEGLLKYGTLRLDADGAIDVDYEKGGFLGLMKQLDGEHDLFFGWVAGNRAKRIMEEGKAALARVEAIKGELRDLRAHRTAASQANDLAGYRRIQDRITAAGKDLVTARERANVQERNFDEGDIEKLIALQDGTMADGRSRTDVYQHMNKELQRYNRSVMDLAEQAGLIDAETRPFWEKDFYVPFYRLMEDEDTKGPVTGAGLIRQYAFKHMKGGKEVLGDPFENTLKNWSHLISASLKNQAGASALEAAEAQGAAEVTVSTAKDAIWVRKAGKPVYYTVSDPLLLDAVKALNAKMLEGPAMKAMSGMKRALTLGVTIAPAFRVRNLLRDTMQAIGTSELSYNMLGNVLQGWKGTKEGTADFAQLLAGGGVMRFGTWLEGDRSANVKRLIESGIAGKNILTNPARIHGMLVKGWRHWQEIGERTENVNRSAIYQQARARGVSHLEASYLARDLMDFSMQGTWGAIRMLTQMVPFMNARLQGLYKLGRAYQEDPLRLMSVTGAVALASIMLAYAYGDDDDWKAREDWDRDNNWWFKIGNEAYWIPKPFEIGAVASMAERGYEALTNPEFGGQDFADRMGAILWSNLSLNPIPQLFKPLVELYANKDTFTDRPIETEWMKKLSVPLRVAPETSATAQVLGKAGVLSPVQIDHLAHGYLGWLGSHVVLAADLFARPALGLADRPAWRTENYPLLGDFAKDLPAYQNRYVTKFYDQAEKVQEALGDLKHYRDIGALDQAKELRAERGEMLRKGPLVRRTLLDLGKINGQIRRVQQMSISAEAKRARLDRLYRERNVRATKASRALEATA